MSLLCGCPAMFTLLLLSCFAAATAAGGPLPRRCGGTACGLSGSQSVRHGSPALTVTAELVALSHRSDNTLRPGTTGAAEKLTSHHYGKRDASRRNNVSENPPASVTRGLHRGSATATSHRQPPSTQFFSGHRFSDKLETNFSKKNVEKLRAKDASDEGKTVSSIYSQRKNDKRPVSTNVLLNKLYTDATLNGRHWPEQLGYSTGPKQIEQTPAQLNKAYRSSELYNWQSGGVLRSRSWKDYGSIASIGDVTQMVKQQTVTLTPVDDDVVNLGHDAATTKDQVVSESPQTSVRKSGTIPQSEKVPSLAQPTASPVQSLRSSVEDQLSSDYRPSGTPDTRQRVDQGVTAAVKSEDISTEPTTLPSTSINEDAVSEDEKEVIVTQNSDLQEQKEDIQDAIARDATLIIVFSCLAVASLAMWRIVRCITMRKLKQHEKKLEAEKASTV